MVVAMVAAVAVGAGKVMMVAQSAAAAAKVVSVTKAETMEEASFGEALGNNVVYTPLTADVTQPRTTESTHGYILT